MTEQRRTTRSFKLVSTFSHMKYQLDVDLVILKILPPAEIDVIKLQLLNLFSDDVKSVVVDINYSRESLCLIKHG